MRVWGGGEGHALKLGVLRPCLSTPNSSRGGEGVCVCVCVCVCALRDRMNDLDSCRRGARYPNCGGDRCAMCTPPCASVHELAYSIAWILAHIHTGARMEEGSPGEGGSADNGPHPHSSGEGQTGWSR